MRENKGMRSLLSSQLRCSLNSILGVSLVFHQNIFHRATDSSGRSMARVVFGGPLAGGRGVGGLPGEADVAGVHVEVVDQVPAPEDVGNGVIRRPQPFFSRPTVRLIHMRRRWVARCPSLPHTRYLPFPWEFVTSLRSDADPLTTSNFGGVTTSRGIII